MNIIQINGSYGEMNSTGRNVKETHQWFKSQGYNSFVFTTTVTDRRELGKDLFLFSSRIDQKLHGLFSHILGKQGFFSKKQTKKLIRKISKLNPDVILMHVLHSNCINFPLLFSYISIQNIPVVLVLHDCWYYTGHCCHYNEANCSKWKENCGQCSEIHNWNSSWFFDRSSENLQAKALWYNSINRLGVIGVSDWITKEAEQSILNNAAIIRKIYNWVDLNVFTIRDKNALRKKLGYNEKDIILLAVASVWTENKGLIEIIKISKEIPQAKIILVGKLPDDSNVPPNIDYVGSISNTEELAQLYSVADLFINPSKQESFGKTTAESLSCGTPVVVYNTTACKELVNPNCGVVVMERNADLFVYETRRLIKEPLSKFQIECRKFALQNFDKEKNMKEYLNLILDIIER